MAGHIQDASSIHWRTPPKILHPVRLALGNIALDPCSNIWSLVGAKVSYMLPEHDGLVDSWDYPTVFVNPPFGKAWWKLDKDGHRQYIFAEDRKAMSEEELEGYVMVDLKTWMERCNAAHRDHGSEVISLTPAYVDTAAWHDVIWPTANAVCFPRGRIKFIMPPEPWRCVETVEGVEYVESWLDPSMPQLHDAVFCRVQCNELAVAKVTDPAPRPLCQRHLDDVLIGLISDLSPPIEKTGPAPMATALSYWGTETYAFEQAFKEIGRVIILDNQR